MLDRTSKTVSSALSSSPEARGPLASMLGELRPLGVAYGRCALSPFWGVSIAEEAVARLHLVVRGRAFLRMGDDAWRELGPGDAVLVPRGDAHALASRPGQTLRPLRELPAQIIGDRVFDLDIGGTDADTLMTCCAVTFLEPSAHPLLALMPAFILVPAASVADPALETVLRLMGEEVLADRLGTATILARLADVAIVRLIRAWAESEPEGRFGWLDASRDPRLGRVLAAVHRDPGKRWSVTEMARLAGMSRSALYLRFQAMLGMAPAEYVHRWRMHVAGIMLREQRLPVGEVAHCLNYGSHEAFSRAFKRATGAPPSRHPAEPGRGSGWRGEAVFSSG